MLILEGPDGGGKTTLAREIHDWFDIPIAPRVVGQDTSAMTNLVDWVDTNLEEGLQWQLFDRHRLISEPIYGTIVRNEMHAKEFLDTQWLTSRMQSFYDIAPIIIYCLPPLEVVKANLRNDPDNTVVAMYAEKLYAAYATRAAIDYALAPSTVVLWDYTTAGDLCRNNLFELIEELKENTHAAALGF